MAAKGHGVAETLREMNAKLKHILPVDMFCCALMLDLSYQRGTVEVWNGGMPDGYRLSATGEVLATLQSRHLPLGILSPERFDDSTEVLPLAVGERLCCFPMAWSIPAMTGAVIRRAAHGAGAARQSRSGAVAAGADASTGAFWRAPRDDISLCDVSMVEPQWQAPAAVPDSEASRSGPLHWSLHFELRGESLKRFNPVPYLVQLLQEIHGLRPNGGLLHTVLSELYANAPEHGVLGLDSRLKHDAQGFADYYRERSLRLARQDDGFVRIDLEVEPWARGGRLKIDVRDSGLGFDVAQVLSGQRQAQG